MATVGEAAIAVRVTADIKQLQQLGWAARAVELAQEPCSDLAEAVEEYETSANHGTAREALLNLAACCLARLWEIP